MDYREQAEREAPSWRKFIIDERKPITRAVRAAAEAKRLTWIEERALELEERSRLYKERQRQLKEAKEAAYRAATAPRTISKEVSLEQLANFIAAFRPYPYELVTSEEVWDGVRNHPVLDRDHETPRLSEERVEQIKAQAESERKDWEMYVSTLTKVEVGSEEEESRFDDDPMGSHPGFYEVRWYDKAGKAVRYPSEPEGWRVRVMKEWLLTEEYAALKAQAENAWRQKAFSFLTQQGWEVV